jgi:hypothetical protein
MAMATTSFATVAPSAGVLRRFDSYVDQVRVTLPRLRLAPAVRPALSSNAFATEEQSPVLLVHLTLQHSLGFRISCMPMECTNDCNPP